MHTRGVQVRRAHPRSSARACQSVVSIAQLVRIGRTPRVPIRQTVRPTDTRGGLQGATIERSLLEIVLGAVPLCGSES